MQLINFTRALYGSPDKYEDHIIEQWKHFAEITHSYHDRLYTANRMYLTIQIAVISGLFIIKRYNQLFSNIELLAIITIACALCIIWWWTLKSMQKEISSKFEIIEKIEDLLPCRPYDYEWHEILGEGKKHWIPTKIIQFVPWLFVLFYAFLFFINFKCFI